MSVWTEPPPTRDGLKEIRNVTERDEEQEWAKAGSLLAGLRRNGWTVAVHNDYRQNGVPMTFWLLTHPNGRYIKGEGKTDREALIAAYAGEQPGESDG